MEIDKWLKTTGVEIQVEACQFLQALTQHLDDREAPLIGKQRVCFREIDEHLFDDVYRRFLAVVVSEGEGETEHVYRVSSEKLAPLRFRFVEQITLVHSLNQKVGNFNMRRMVLSDFLSRTCGRGAFDYVCAMGLADIKISGQFTGRRRIDCIVHAAILAGGVVELVQRNEIHTATGSPEHLARHLRATSDYGEALRDFVNRDFLGEWKDESVEPPIETVLDAWRNIVLTQVKEWKSERALIRIVPRPPERK